jgi:FkbM family methyltransferase
MKWLRQACDVAGASFYSLGRLCHQSPQEQRVRPWCAAKGDKTLRLEYDLNADSVVFDIGGYEGQWASDIFGRYGCTIHVFEPVPAFADNIRRRFSRNPRIHVHSFGLAAAGRVVRMYEAADSSSLFQRSRNNIVVKLTGIAEFLEEEGIGQIDLMKINIEGGEYDLLEFLIERGLTYRIHDLQIQFHDFVDEAERRMYAIQQHLARTHYQTYAYEFVWENWRLKAVPG